MKLARTFALTATLLVFLGETSGALAQGLQPAATLSYVLGDVEIARGSATAWRTARVSQALFAGDRIRTGADGQAELVFGGASRMRLAENTHLLIPDRAENREGLLQRVSVFVGSVWANLRRLARNESFEVEGGHSIGGVKGTRFQLDRSQADDRWRLATGRLAIRRKGTAQSVTLEAGQQVTVGPDRIRPVEKADVDELDQSYLRFNRAGARRWQGVISRLLAAERRLVQRAQREGSEGLAEARRKSREIGEALRDAERQIQAFVAQRQGDPGDRRSGTGDLQGFVERALASYRRLHAQLEEERGQRPEGPGDGRPDAGDQQILRMIRTSDGFLTRYLHALRRSLRILQLHIKGVKKLPKAAILKIRRRQVDGFRQSEAAFFRARDALRLSGTPRRSPGLQRAFQQLEAKWRRIGRNFRIARELVEKALAVRQPPPNQEPPREQYPGGPTAGQQTIRDGESSDNPATGANR